MSEDAFSNFFQVAALSPGLRGATNEEFRWLELPLEVPLPPSYPRQSSEKGRDAPATPTLSDGDYLILKASPQRLRGLPSSFGFSRLIPSPHATPPPRPGSMPPDSDF